MIARRSPIRRSSKPLKRSWLPRGTKKIPQENVEATRKRRLRNQKRMRSPEYKAARAGAMERSGGRCEFQQWNQDVQPATTSAWLVRCPETNRLQFHEERYRKVGPVRAEDGKILCPPHHRLAEKAKPHKWHTRGFA